MNAKTDAKTEEQKFLEAVLEAPPESLMPTSADEAEFAAIWDRYRAAMAAQEGLLDIGERLRGSKGLDDR